LRFGPVTKPSSDIEMFASTLAMAALLQVDGSRPIPAAGAGRNTPENGGQAQDRGVSDISVGSRLRPHPDKHTLAATTLEAGPGVPPAETYLRFRGLG
jgi:hypothetical protein